MWRLSWQTFKERRGRAVLVACVLAFTVALLGCLYSMARTVANTADALAESAGVGLQVMPRTWLTDAESTGAVGTPLNDEVLATVKSLAEVEDVRPHILGRGLIPLRSDGSPYIPAMAATQSGAFEEGGRLTLIDGEAPNNAGEVVIDAVTLKELGKSLGDEVLLIHDASSRTLNATIVGVVELAGSSPGTSSFVMLSPAQARDLFLGGQQGWNAFALTLADGADINAVAGAVNSTLPYGYVSATPTSIDNAHRFWLHPALTGTLLALAALGLLVILATIALTNTVFGRLVRRQHESIVSLRVMGASRLMTWQMVMSEGLAVAVTGSLAGVLLAALLQGWAHNTLAQAGMPIGSPSPGLGFDGAAVVFGVGVLCALLAANQHALAATRTYPISVRRFSAASQWLGEEAWSGIGLVAVGFVLMFAQRLGAMPVPVLWALVASGALIAGAALTSSMVGRPALVWLTTRIPGHVGALTRVMAHQATQRPHRLSVGLAILVMATAVLAASGVVGASGKATAEREIPQSFTATHLITNQRGHSFSPELTQFVAAVPGVTGVNSVAIHHANVNGKPLSVAVSAPEDFPAVFATEVRSGRAPTQPNEVMVSSSWAKEHGIALDDLFRFTHGRSNIALRVVGIFHVAGEFSPADIVTVREALTSRGIADVDTWVGLSLSSEEAYDEVVAAMAPIIESNPLMMVTTPTELGQLKAEAVAEDFLPFTEFFQVALTAGALGLALLLALAVLDRRRDYGALRVMGASEQQLAAMMLGEGVLLAAFGMILGLISGTISGWAIQHALVYQGFSTLATPLTTSVLPLLLAIPVGLIAAIPAAALVRRTTLSHSLPTP